MKNTSLSRILGAVKPYTIYIIFSFILAVATVVLTLYIPVLTGEAIDCIVGVGEVDFEGIRDVLIKMAVVIPTCAIATYVMNLINSHISYSASRDLRDEAFEKLQRLPIKYFDTHPQGDIASRIITDADTVADGLLLGFANLFTGVITILGTLIFMGRLSLLITVIVVVVTPVSLLVARFIARRSYDKFHAQSVDRGEQMSVTEEAISHMDVIRVFGAREKFIENFTASADKLKGDSLAAVFFSSITNPATRFVNSLVYAAVGVFGAIYAVSGGISVGMLSAFLGYANQYTKPFNEISGVITELTNALAGAGRIFEIIDEKEEYVKNDDILLTDTDGNITFDKVDFSYDEERPLIEDLDIFVTNGSRVAIVGPTGAGKSTIINLLMRFYDVDEGRILVSGKDVRDVTRDSLRSHFGMVLQETWVREGTVRENITLGREGFSDEDVIAAAKRAHAHSFIKRLPEGYDTVLGEDGGGLSAGEKQLLCVARVMLAIPEMLILDEATSSIDVRTEARIGEAFAEMMQGRTSFIIAHRLQTIRNADLILVMRDGKIVEKGAHDELLAKGGFYKELYLASVSE